MVISYAAFGKYYPQLMKVISSNSCVEIQTKAAEILLAMNGENDKAWNLKKKCLTIGFLDVKRELRFNRAVCLKFKKSTAYYEYRLFLIRREIESIVGKNRKLL